MEASCTVAGVGALIGGSHICKSTFVRYIVFRKNEKNFKLSSAFLSLWPGENRTFPYKVFYCTSED